jgi:hypothetical protein
MLRASPSKMPIGARRNSTGMRCALSSMHKTTRATPGLQARSRSASVTSAWRVSFQFELQHRCREDLRCREDR